MSLIIIPSPQAEALKLLVINSKLHWMLSHVQVTNALSKLPGCWGRWSWVCPWGSQPQSFQWQWDSHRVVDLPPAAPSSPPDIEWVRRNHENSCHDDRVAENIVLFRNYKMMHNLQVAPWWGDAEDWILIGWMCHMIMLSIHAYLQYGDVMTSRSKGIGQWEHHILGTKRI